MRGGPFGSVVDEVHLGYFFVFPLRLKTVISFVFVDGNVREEWQPKSLKGFSGSACLT